MALVLNDHKKSIFDRITGLLIPAFKEAGVESADPDLDVKLNVLALLENATDIELADIVGYIKWAEKNGVHYLSVAADVMHDLNGIVRKEDCFVPRTSGYAHMERG